MKNIEMNHAGPVSKSLRGAYLVPGLPHLMSPVQNASYDSLRKGLGVVAEDMRRLGVERIVYFSTQWMSVLSTSFQARKNLSGLHVDENWHDLADLKFDFNVDVSFAQALAESAKVSGFVPALVDFEGFPVDTGAIVADSFVNPKHLKTNMVSCHVYSSFEDTVRLGASIRKSVEESGVPTAAVAVSTLSGNYFTTPIDLREDKIRDPKDQAWDQKMIALLESGNFSEVDSNKDRYAKEARVDMGFKAYAWLKGLMGEHDLRPVSCLAYGAIYGTGNAVVRF